MSRYWNHRIIATVTNDEIFMGIHEVHYENDVPTDFTEKPIAVVGENSSEIKWVLRKMQDASKKPVLWGDSRFPQEVQIKFMCRSCGRDTFDRPGPHKCNGQFRKRKLLWKTIYK